MITAFDARMGEVYLAAYLREAGEWRAVIAPQLVGAPVLAAQLPALPPALPPVLSSALPTVLLPKAGIR